MTTISKKTINVDNCSISCLTAGSAAKKTVILLHGMKFRAATWQDLGTLQQLSKSGFHAVAVDMPGFGESPPCSLDNNTVLCQVIDNTGCEKVVLIGPSMGGRTALEYTISRQESVAGLVLVGAVGVEDNRDNLKSIKVPTLLVWGGEDAISPLGNCELLADSITGSRKIIIDGAPHPCYLDNPEKWHTELINFLTSIPF